MVVYNLFFVAAQNEGYIEGGARLAQVTDSARGETDHGHNAS